MDCGNLLHVAKAMRKRYTKGDIVILADIGNGQKEAEAAARAVGGVCAVPDLADGEGSDFNDMAARRGLDAVAKVINEALARGPETVQGETSQETPGEDTHEPGEGLTPPPIDTLLASDEEIAGARLAPRCIVDDAFLPTYALCRDRAAPAKQPCWPTRRFISCSACLCTGWKCDHLAPCFS